MSHITLVRVIAGPGAPYEIALERQPAVRIEGWDHGAHAAAA